jgi:hypothetical protein
MFKYLKRISYVLVLASLCIGFAAIVASILTPRMVIGERRLSAFIHQVEVFDFKWWITGLAFGLWLIPISLLITYRIAKRAGQELRDFKGILRRILADRALPIVVDIDQKIPIRLEGPLDLPVELHTEISLDCEVALEADVPVRTELPLETTVHADVLGLGTIGIPIRARIPIDVVVPFKGHTRVRASGVPVDLTRFGVVRLPEIEIPVRARIQARIDLLSNFVSAESFLATTDRSLLGEIKRGIARLWHPSPK